MTNATNWTCAFCGCEWTPNEIGESCPGYNGHTHIWSSSDDGKDKTIARSILVTSCALVTFSSVLAARYYGELRARVDSLEAQLNTLIIVRRMDEDNSPFPVFNIDMPRSADKRRPAN